AVVISAALARRRPDRVIGAGVLCCTGGLVLFLAVARPQSPAVSVAPTILLPLSIGVAGAIALCLVAWRVSPRRYLPLATAFACGVIFEVTAFLLKEITQTIGLGFNPLHSSGRSMRSSSPSRSVSCLTRMPSRRAPS